MSLNERIRKLEIRMSGLEGKIDDVHGCVKELLVAIVGSSKNPGVGLQIRVDRLERLALVLKIVIYAMMVMLLGVVGYAIKTALLGG